MEEVIAALNQNNPAVGYSLSGNTIVGAWSQSATATGAFGQNKMNINYLVTVTLNPDRTYTYVERIDSGSSDAGANAANSANMLDPMGAMNLPGQRPSDEGTSLFSSSKNTFRGKTFGTRAKGFSFEFGGRPGQNSYTYDFDASSIKQPLLQALNTLGYTEKKTSVFKRLFG